MMPYVICIVGKAGSGKTTISNILKDLLKAKLINLDEIGHKVLRLEPIKNKLIQIFGKEILDVDNEIDRRKLGNIVFNSKDSLKKLNSIVHPKIKEIVEKTLKEIRGNVIIEGALIKDIGLIDFCDKIICVNVSEKTCIERLIKRGIEEKKARAILQSQRNLKLEPCDLVFINENLELSELNQQLKELVKHL